VRPGGSVDAKTASDIDRSLRRQGGFLGPADGMGDVDRDRMFLPGETGGLDDDGVLAADEIIETLKDAIAGTQEKLSSRIVQSEKSLEGALSGISDKVADGISRETLDERFQWLLERFKEEGVDIHWPDEMFGWLKKENARKIFDTLDGKIRQLDDVVAAARAVAERKADKGLLYAAVAVSAVGALAGLGALAMLALLLHR
jgi:hypothetical protein